MKRDNSEKETTETDSSGKEISDKKKKSEQEIFET